VAERASLRALLDDLADRDIGWISDEVYGTLGFRDDSTLPSQLSRRGMACNSLSKSHALMGWRIGWLRAPEDVVRNLIPLQQMTVTCAPVPLQHAALAALANPEIEYAVSNAMLERRNLALELCDTLADVARPLESSALYLFLDVSTWCDGDDLSLAMALLDHGVIVIPGRAFGPGGRGH